MPAARPEIDQLHLLGDWELPTKIAKKYSNYIAKVKKAKLLEIKGIHEIIDRNFYYIANVKVNKVKGWEPT